MATSSPNIYRASAPYTRAHDVEARELDTGDDYFYTGNDLGITYSKEKTAFRLWAPLAEKVALIIYEEGDVESGDNGRLYEMEKSEKGTWVITLDGDLHGLFYTYKVTNYGVEVESGDPYAIAVGINGDRSAVVDLASTDPPEWVTDRRPPFSGEISDAVIYELHIRDLAMHETSGIKNKGKYIEFEEEDTRGPGGISTGINHLKELGITHLHLLPTYDYASIDEKTLELNEFNWGYDPKNYNVPEGSYATDPYDPTVRISEYKRMIWALHKNGIRVVFDAVYNHTFHNFDSFFHKIVPGYYYRMMEGDSFCNGTGCGNETASERKMMRRFIIDSIKYWVTEYHIDGFRFDLMGIHDIETMREIRRTLDQIDPGIIVFGEGWDLGNLPREKRAIQPYAHKMPGISFFNDHFRDNLRGPWNNDLEHGFIDGKPHLELEIMQGVVGSIQYNDVVKDYNFQPGQSINYVANHDNQTLWDKLMAANPDVEDWERKKQHKLGVAIILTSQGVTYLQSGIEFLRTKGGEHNSYRSPDYINALDWRRKHENPDVFNFIKNLVSLRKAHPAFRMSSTDMIKENISFLPSPRNTVAYLIKNAANGDSWRNILVIHNAGNKAVTVKIPEATWNTVLKEDEVNLEPQEKARYSQVLVGAVSTRIMITQEQIIIDDMFFGAEIIKTQVNSDRFLTEQNGINSSEEIRTGVSIRMEGDTIYLPFKGLAESIGANITTDTAEFIEVINEPNKIRINKFHKIVEVNDKTISGEWKTKVTDGVFMVSEDMAEDLLGIRILVDFRRFCTDTHRADYFQPDIYILYVR